MDELRSLTKTAGALPVAEMLQKRQKPSVKSFIGKGKVRELAELVKLHEAQVVIFENDLSPAQIGNIEKVCEVKVLDRSELILDIFAGRAQTVESRLQVEIAQLEYTYPRLRAMWSHLERIAGGGVGTRGPGEQQLEIDRRIVQRKKSQLRKELTELQKRKTREVQARNKGHFTVGIVGYTNAGKSTLFNTVTDAGVLAEDKLFATLGTRTREWALGQGDAVMLSDTVGFVRNLPHLLVASFKATLEEAVHSQLLLIVLDVSDPHCQRQLRTVNQVLDEIGATDQPRLLLLNKTDKVDHNADLLILQKEQPDALPISAVTGEGLDTLVQRVREHLHGGVQTLTLNLAQADGKGLTYLENRAQVLDRAYEGDRVKMTVNIGTRQLDELRAMGGSLIEPQAPAAGGGWGR